MTFEEPARDSQEQADQAVALAHGPAGFVAVGSNGDVFSYAGRIWTSVDGRDWRLVSARMLPGLELTDVAADATTYVAIGTRSADPNAPEMVVLASRDGESWQETYSADDAWAVDVAAGPGGFVTSIEVDSGTDLLVSPDGRTWTRVPAGDVAGAPYLPQVAAAGEGWLAAGTDGDHAVVLRSRDGRTWLSQPLPASGPVDGIESVSAYSVQAGRWATLVLGVDSPPCDDAPDWCPHHQAAWSGSGETWARLPKSTRILGLGHGVSVWPADDAGFVAWGDSGVMTSADGWSWRDVRSTASPDSYPLDMLVTDDAIVAVGMPFGDDLILRPWFGYASIER